MRLLSNLSETMQGEVKYLKCYKNQPIIMNLLKITFKGEGHFLLSGSMQKAIGSHGVQLEWHDPEAPLPHQLPAALGLPK